MSPTNELVRAIPSELWEKISAMTGQRTTFHLAMTSKHIGLPVVRTVTSEPCPGGRENQMREALLHDRMTRTFEARELVARGAVRCGETDFVRSLYDRPWFSRQTRVIRFTKDAAMGESADLLADLFGRYNDPMDAVHIAVKVALKHNRVGTLKAVRSILGDEEKFRECLERESCWIAIGTHGNNEMLEYLDSVGMFDVSRFVVDDFDPTAIGMFYYEVLYRAIDKSNLEAVRFLATEEYRAAFDDKFDIEEGSISILVFWLINDYFFDSSELRHTDLHIVQHFRETFPEDFEQICLKSLESEGHARNLDWRHHNVFEGMSDDMYEIFRQAAGGARPPLRPPSHETSDSEMLDSEYSDSDESSYV